MIAEASRRRFTVIDYHKMVDAGILDEDDRVELIDGEIVEMSPIGSRHVAFVNILNEIIRGALGPLSIVQVQSPVHFGELSEPEPDIAVLQQNGDFFQDALPGPDDVLFLVEVADSSLIFDRNRKLPPCARAGIREVWIVDLDHRTVERHSQPENGAYQSATLAASPEELPSTVLPQIRLSFPAFFR